MFNLAIDSNCGVWRGRLVIVSPDVRRSSPLAGGKATYRSVQIPGASSLSHHQFHHPARTRKNQR
jgi:hypothetical protein